jgi:hypothetical protein
MIGTTRAGSTFTFRSLPWLALIALLLGVGACQKAERLLLLDVQASGQLPTTVSALRFSAMDWQTRAVAGVLGPAGLKFGYYGPSGSGPVTVTVEAIDARNCVLGTGSATVPDTSSGQTATPTVVYVRPLESTMCMFRDAGLAEAAADAAAAADADADAGASSDTEGGTDAGTDSRSDARADRSDGAADRSGDAARDTGAAGDAGVDAITGADVAPVSDGGGTDASPG